MNSQAAGEYQQLYHMVRGLEVHHMLKNLFLGSRIEMAILQIDPTATSVLLKNISHFVSIH